METRSLKKLFIVIGIIMILCPLLYTTFAPSETGNSLVLIGSLILVLVGGTLVLLGIISKEDKNV